MKYAESNERWRARVADIWQKATGEGDEVEVFLAINRLVQMRSADDPVAIFELASAYDYSGQDIKAEQFYRTALALGLDEQRRARAVLQLASSLRNLQRPLESVALLRAELADIKDPALRAAGAAFLSLALLDCACPAQAAEAALAGLVPFLSDYKVSLARYVNQLAEHG
ncbi:MAG: tetratricopeptide repeat protein [Pseudonocardiaceae bacterium]